MMKIGFLFNHDAGHQAGHLLPILNAVASTPSQIEIRAYVGGSDMRDIVLRGVEPKFAHRIKFVHLRTPPMVRPIARAADIFSPASRVARLVFNADAFRDLDALVAPERTSLILKDLIDEPSVKFIHVRHGAGDRAIGFHPSFAKFDLLLLQGEKYVRRLRKSGGLDGRNQYALIGYPKFDQLPKHGVAKKFFDNDRPTVVYNPHFSPDWSSWYSMGEAVLDYFAGNRDFNLIFAPHVMLFNRRMHVSPETARIAWRRRLADRFRRCDNIHVDLDSANLFDMSYMNSADIYLGDISSQVIEFIARPRPCVFLNPRDVDWRGDENFSAWRLGPVLPDLSSLDGALARAVERPDEYALAQRAHFQDTFDLTAEPSAARAARAIVDFVAGETRRDQRETALPEIAIPAKVALSS
ncbi:MAG: hypothetical protein KDA46_10970 [Parvularculaceae bacterium]|nr:hypothetical protein [Parvularculaceae bacterium]